MGQQHKIYGLELGKRDYHSLKHKREHTHSVTVFEDFSLLKASWYLRLSTSFFIWGKSISSMAVA